MKPVDIAERFLWTAIQAFLGSLPVTIDLSHDNWKAIGYSGLSAGLAAVISLAKNLTLSAQTK